MSATVDESLALRPNRLTYDSIQANRPALNYMRLIRYCIAKEETQIPSWESNLRRGDQFPFKIVDYSAKGAPIKSNCKTCFGCIMKKVSCNTCLKIHLPISTGDLMKLYTEDNIRTTLDAMRAICSQCWSQSISFLDCHHNHKYFRVAVHPAHYHCISTMDRRQHCANAAQAWQNQQIQALTKWERDAQIYSTANKIKYWIMKCIIKEFSLDDPLYNPDIWARKVEADKLKEAHNHCIVCITPRIFCHYCSEEHSYFTQWEIDYNFKDSKICNSCKPLVVSQHCEMTKPRDYEKQQIWEHMYPTIPMHKAKEWKCMPYPNIFSTKEWKDNKPGNQSSGWHLKANPETLTAEFNAIAEECLDMRCKHMSLAVRLNLRHDAKLIDIIKDASQIHAQIYNSVAMGVLYYHLVVEQLEGRTNFRDMVHFECLKAKTEKMVKGYQKMTLV